MTIKDHRAMEPCPSDPADVNEGNATSPARPPPTEASVGTHGGINGGLEMNFKTWGRVGDMTIPGLFAVDVYCAIDHCRQTGVCPRIVMTPYCVNETSYMNVTLDQTGVPWVSHGYTDMNCRWRIRGVNYDDISVALGFTIYTEHLSKWG